MSSRFCTDVVADEPLPHIKHLYNYKTASEFEADVIYLKAHYRLPTWQQFLEERSQGPRPGRPTALLTFDDGMAQCFENARPVLLKHQVPCVFFITKGFVDNRSMFYRHKGVLVPGACWHSDPSRAIMFVPDMGWRYGIGKFFPRGFSTWIKGLEIVDEGSIDRVCDMLEIYVATELVHRSPYMTSDQIKQLARDGFSIGGHTARYGRLQLFAEAVRERDIVDSL